MQENTENATTNMTDAAMEALRSLEPLVGTWAIDGPGMSGTVRYEWMDGGGFLVQHIDLLHDDEATRGVEYIGFHAESGELRSHYFSGKGEILEYVYELVGDTLTIWYGGVGSPAKFVGRFDADRVRNAGAWQWPGGGYESNMTRVEEPAR